MLFDNIFIIYFSSQDRSSLLNAQELLLATASAHTARMKSRDSKKTLVDTDGEDRSQKTAAYDARVQGLIDQVAHVIILNFAHH